MLHHKTGGYSQIFEKNCVKWEGADKIKHVTFRSDPPLSQKCDLPRPGLEIIYKKIQPQNI